MGAGAEMPDFGPDIDAAFSTDEPLSREKVLLWIDASSDLPTLAKLYRLTDECYYRIQPDLGMDITCNLIQRYLLECIRQNVAGDDEIQNRWEAAGTLNAWFCHLGDIPDTSTVLTSAARAVTELFITSGDEVRNAIEQGFLEHALEMAALRPYFEYWSSDSRLQAAWDRALKWGKAHPDYTWKLLQQIGKKER
jgi:hypothetical protein